jgi:hypothetical protein
MFINDHNNLSVDPEKGSIELIITAALLNGKSISTKLGRIPLREAVSNDE